MALSWVSVNANDGSIIADLPGLIVGGALKRTIGRAETQTATLPLGPSQTPKGGTFRRAPRNWRQATRTKAVFLVALDEDEVPVWGGMVTERQTTHASGVELSLETAEGYFADRYVGNESLNAPQNTIVKTLVEKYAKTGTRPGIPIRVQALPGANPARKRDYADKEDKTLGSVLEELSGIIGGPEWTIGWERDSINRITPVLYVGARIGAAAPVDLNPAAQFYLPGSVRDAVLVESYKRGDGANDVMATSSGAGDARPQSPRQTNPSDLRPTVEFRWSPSSSITATDTLTDHARRALAGMKDGAIALAITATRKNAPRLGSVWDLGDDIGFDLTGPAWPDGVTGTARVLAIEVTDTTVTPILDVRSIEGID
jgi:hypothetical protein